MMKMFDKRNFRKRCCSTLITIPWIIEWPKKFKLQANTFLRKKANHLQIVKPPVVVQNEKVIFLEKV